MSFVNSDSVLHNIVKKMMKKRNIIDYKFNIDGGTEKGDGYIGEILFFHVLMNNQRQNFILKSEKSQEYLKQIGSDILNNRELSIYTTVIPVLEEFIKFKNGIELSTFIPKLWFADKHLNQVNIVLENLKTQNCYTHDRRKPMDFSHMRILFETYGKWHGISMAFKDQNPEKFSELVESWTDPRLSLIQNCGLVEQFKKEFVTIKKMLISRGRFDLVKIYEGFEDQIEEVSYRKNVDRKDLVIISHGDNWSTNYLFKYKDSPENSTPNQVYLIDFQLARLDSPALELSSTLYNTGDKNTFENFDQLLSIYHETLSRTLTSLGSDPELFTMEELRRQWKKHGLHSILGVFLYLRVALCDPEEAPDLAKLAENGADFDAAFGFHMHHMETFWKRALDVYIHFGEFLKQFT